MKCHATPSNSDKINHSTGGGEQFGPQEIGKWRGVGSGNGMAGLGLKTGSGHS